MASLAFIITQPLPPLRSISISPPYLCFTLNNLNLYSALFFLLSFSTMDFKWVMNFLFWVAIFLCFCSSDGHRFSVGGKDGWVLHPSDDYSHWSERNRFLVNDTLYFKYKKGEDSVLQVTKDDYYNCNTSNWVFKDENGESEFKFTRSGPFFFISGFKDHCHNGQKLLIVVLSEKHRRAVLAPTPASFHQSPATTPVSSPPSGESSPPPSSTSPPAVTPAPENPEDVPPVPVPSSPKAAASALSSALLISVAVVLSSSLILQAL